jgi:DHA2 family methylenomycin A resistance protein-like MFS transporter
MENKQTKKSGRFALLVAATSLGFVVVQLDVSIVNVALTRIGSALSTEVDGLQWVVDAYTVAFASFLLCGGALGDRLGARKVFVAGMAVFSVASLGCGLASGIGTLIAARAAQGFGAALLMPCSLALLNHGCADEPPLRARAVGLWTASGGASLAAGPLLGGVMVGRLGWESIFLVNVPIGGLAIWLVRGFIDETPPVADPPPFDWAGQVLAALTLFALTGAFIEAGSLGWREPVVVAGMGVAVVAAAAFLSIERRARAPMLPSGLFTRPAVLAANLTGLAANFAVYGTIFSLSFYFQRTKGYSPEVTGLAFLPFMLVLTVVNIAAGGIVGRYGPRLPMAGGCALGAAGFVLLALIRADTSYLSLIARLLFLPVGIGLAIPAMTTMLLASVPRHLGGTASGVLNTVRQAAGAIGVALFGSLMSMGIMEGMRTAFVGSALLVAAAGSAVLMLVRRERRAPDA